MQATPVLINFHIVIPMALNTNVAKTCLGLATYLCCSSMRLMDPLADLLLAAKVILAAGKGICPFGATNDCGKQYLVGWIIVGASVLDYVLSACSLLALKKNFK
jgi:hypothetical protein